MKSLAADFQTEAARLAAGVALMVVAAADAETGADGIVSAILMVLGDDIAERGGKGAGAVIVKLVVAFTRALEALAEERGVSMMQAAADLVAAPSKGI